MSLSFGCRWRGTARSRECPLLPYLQPNVRHRHYAQYATYTSRHVMSTVSTHCASIATLTRISSLHFTHCSDTRHFLPSASVLVWPRTSEIKQQHDKPRVALPKLVTWVGTAQSDSRRSLTMRLTYAYTERLESRVVE